MLSFLRNCQSVFQSLLSFYIPTNNELRVPVASLPVTGIVILLNFDHPNICFLNAFTFNLFVEILFGFIYVCVSCTFIFWFFLYCFYCITCILLHYLNSFVGCCCELNVSLNVHMLKS